MRRRLHEVSQTWAVKEVMFRGGDVVDLEELYRQDYAHLVGLADWVLGHRGLAEEMVQETFARVLENPPRLQDPGSLGAYMRSAVLNRCRSRIRRLVLERKHARAGALQSHNADQPDTAVRDAVLQLPMRQRQCVALRFYDDLTVDQIAEVLDISGGSVKTHLHRAMQSLGSVLGERTEQ